MFVAITSWEKCQLKLIPSFELKWKPKYVKYLKSKNLDSQGFDEKLAKTIQRHSFKKKGIGAFEANFISTNNPFLPELLKFSVDPN